MNSLSPEQFALLRDQVRIVLVTATDTERRALAGELDCCLDDGLLGEYRGLSLGFFNRYLVAHAHCHGMGDDAAAEISHVLRLLRPETAPESPALYVILVGIAFGLRRGAGDTRSFAEPARLIAFLEETEEALRRRRGELGAVYDDFTAAADALLTAYRAEGVPPEKVPLPLFLTPETGEPDPLGQGQAMGDILIAESIQTYAREKEAAGAREDRNRRVPCAPETTRKLYQHGRQWQGGYPVHLGPVVSGPKLVNSFLFREELRVRYPDAIGGEMEGSAAATLVAGFHDAEAPSNAWLVLVKAICDWGVVKGDAAQVTAARAAVTFLHHCFGDESLFGDLAGPVDRKALARLLAGGAEAAAPERDNFFPSRATLRPKTSCYTGREDEDAFLKQSLASSLVRVTLLEGPRGGGKSEIFRQAWDWIAARSDAVFVLDFARPDIAEGWYIQLLNYYREATGRAVLPGEPDNPDACCDALRRDIARHPAEKFLLVLENAEEALLGGRDDALRALIDGLIAAPSGGLRTLVLSSAPLDDDVFPALRGASAALQRCPIGPLSEAEAIRLMEKWEAARRERGWPRDRRFERALPEEKAHFVREAECLPRVLRTLDGILALDRWKAEKERGGTYQAQSSLAAFLDWLRGQTPDATSGEGKLSAYLGAQFQMLALAARNVVLLLAAILRPVGVEELLEARNRYRESLGERRLQASEKAVRSLAQRLNELQAVQVAAKTESGWTLPGQLVDILTAGELANAPLSDQRAVYHAAAQLFQARIQGRIGVYNEGSGFIGGYRFEDPGFRGDLADWVRCLGHVDHAQARLHLLRVLLEAMNWYAEIADYDAIEMLLKAWQETEAHRDLPAFHDSFARFYREYPKEQNRDDARPGDLAPRWDEVLDALTTLEAQLALDERHLAAGARTARREDFTLCRAFLAQYRAEAISELGAEAYPGGDTEAAALYERACALLERLDAAEEDAEWTWAACYFRVKLFWHHFRLGRRAPAAAALRLACDKRDRDDREIEARLFDACAALFWESAERERAIRCGFAAVLQAYLYLYTQAYLLDAYSRPFYTMLCTRLFRSLRALAADDLPDALSRCRSLRADWERLAAILPAILDAAPPLREMTAWDPVETETLLRGAAPPPAERDAGGGLYGRLVPALAATGHDAKNERQALYEEALASLDGEIDGWLAECVEAASRPASLASPGKNDA